MLPGQVILEPCGEHKPVVIVERGSQLGAGDRALWYYLGDGVNRTGLVVSVEFLVESRQPHPERVAVEDAVNPDLGVPLLQRQRHTWRDVCAESEISGEVEH